MPNRCLLVPTPRLAPRSPHTRWCSHPDPTEVRATRVESPDGEIGVVSVRDISRWKAELDARFDEILQLSSPVIELGKGVLLVPIIGALTASRATELSRGVLEQIEDKRARRTILDISGITGIDAEVASHLARIVASARLMGCSPIVSGLSPDTVEAVYEAGVSWQDVPTTGSLKQAMRMIEAGTGTTERPHTSP